MSNGFFKKPEKAPVQPWSPEEDVLLVGLYLEGRSYKTIGAALGRDPDKNIIDTRIWKLSCNYVDFTPDPNGPNRAHTPWTLRELKMLCTARNYSTKNGSGPKGRELGPYTFARLLYLSLIHISEPTRPY